MSTTNIYFQQNHPDMFHCPQFSAKTKEEVEEWIKQQKEEVLIKKFDREVNREYWKAIYADYFVEKVVVVTERV